MREQFRQHLQQLCTAIRAMGERAGVMNDEALDAFLSRNMELANRIIRDDDLIDEQELENEERIIQLIAMHQPVATDLRSLVAWLRVIADIERVGDLAVKSAKAARRVVHILPHPSEKDLRELGLLVRANWLDAMNALESMNVELAESVRRRDDPIDRANKALVREFANTAQRTEEEALLASNFVTVSRNLERVADHAQDIAEEVIFAVTGASVRHPRVTAT